MNVIMTHCVVFHATSNHRVVPRAAPGGRRRQQSAEKEATEPGLPAALHRRQAGRSARHLHPGGREEVQRLLQQAPPWPAAVPVLRPGRPAGPRVCE